MTQGTALSLTALVFGCFAFIAPAFSLNISLPGEAQLTREVDLNPDTYFLPIGPLSDGVVPSKELEGRVVRQAWRIVGEELSTLSLVEIIRAHLQADGYSLLLDCTSIECGGFDFRFGTDVVPAPDMFVDLFDFRFLSAEKSQADKMEYVSALVSRAGQAHYVQLILVGTQDKPVLPTPLEQVEEDLVDAEQEVGLPQMLLSTGHVVLEDLIFATGSSTLEAGSFASLAALAAFLKEDTDRRIVLVGHTDAIGQLSDNVALSKARASSVMKRLIEDHEVSQAQLASEGMGYLAPVATNSTEEGRRANRRVEAVLLNTQ